MGIKIGDSIYTGAKQDAKGNPVCEKCGGGDEMKLIAHADSADYYISQFQCKCGNIIGEKIKREEEDKMLWS